MREIEIVEHPQINGLRVFFDTVHYRTPHIHRELELIWLAAGTLDVRIEQTRLQAAPGEMVLFHPGQLHAFRAVGDGCTFLCVQIAPELAAYAYPALGRLRFAQPCPGRVLPRGAYHALVQTLLRLAQSYLEQRPGYELTCAGCACLLLGALVEGMPHELLSGGELAGQQRRNDRALRLMRYVDENYTHKVNLSDFAQAEGLSLGYASHFARAALGQSFQDYVDTVRFYAACKQIAAGRARLVGQGRAGVHQCHPPRRAGQFPRRHPPHRYRSPDPDGGKLRLYRRGGILPGGGYPAGSPGPDHGTAGYPARRSV